MQPYSIACLQNRSHNIKNSFWFLLPWCFYQSSLALGKKPGFHKDWVKTQINEEYLPKVLPIYQKLASSELLSRCVGGLTQSSNEALHSTIWNKCCKENSASRSRVLIAVPSALSEFNVGRLKALKHFRMLMALQQVYRLNIYPSLLIIGEPISERK
ncbi:uncharacterized protein TNCV_5048091 [Trichonephila clavipes]|nr:uncharacterized protein TNCV_5048091 [Trichonephila clavipes]